MTRLLLKTFAKEFLHRKISIVLAPTFLVLSGVIFGLGLRSDSTNLDATSFASLLIILSLLSILLCSNNLFYPLLHNQSLLLFLLHPISFRQVIMLRIVIHWLFHVAPTALLTPIISFLFFADASNAFSLVFPILFGSLSLTLLNALIAALTIGLPSGAFFSSILFLPLATPLLLFTLMSTTTLSSTDTLSAFFLILLSIPILAVANLFITSALLRQTFS